MAVYLEDLTKAYEQSQANLLKLLEKKTATGRSTVYVKQLLASVDDELRVLEQFQKQWVKTNIPMAYNDGRDEAYQAYRDMHIDVNKVQINQKVMANLIRNTSGNLTDANMEVGRRLKDTIRQIALEVTQQHFSEGKTTRETQKRLLAELTNEGILEIKDKRGHLLNPTYYANMVGRTTTREATNVGTLKQVTGSGHDLVYIPPHMTTCKLCLSVQGRVYSVSGKDPRYPPLSQAFRHGYHTVHPNCKHNAVPYVESLDDNAAQMRKDSNRDFDKLSAKDEAALKRYDKDQEVKAFRRKERNEWEAKKLADPEGTAKTFSGYRAQQRAIRKKLAESKAKIPAPRSPAMILADLDKVPEDLMVEEVLAQRGRLCSELLDIEFKAPTRWSGVIRKEDSLTDRRGALAYADWNGDVVTDSDFLDTHTLVHELVHHRSTGLTPDAYIDNRPFEEGLVETFARFVTKKYDLSIPPGGYEKWVQAFGKVATKLDKDPAAYSLDILKIPLDQRSSVILKDLRAKLYKGTRFEGMDIDKYNDISDLLPHIKHADSLEFDKEYDDYIILYNAEQDINYIMRGLEYVTKTDWINL